MTSEAEAGARSVLDRRAFAPVLAAVDALAPSLGEAWIVGGAVRDAVLGCAHADLDLTIVGSAHAYGDALAAALGGTASRHDAFGTGTIRGPGGLRLDLATARREVYPAPGALPAVEPTESLEEDLRRRDFSVNAVAVGLSPGVRGRVVDPTGGLAAIAAAELTMLHPRSFVDDPTRVLRGLRYAVRLGFFFDDATTAALDSAVGGGAVATVSGARILAELRLAAEEATFLEFVGALEPFGVARALAPTWRPGSAELLLGAAEGALDRLAGSFDPVGRRLVRLAALWLGTTSADAAALVGRLPFATTELATFAAAERAAAAAEGVAAAATPSAIARVLDPLPLPAVALVAALCELRRASGDTDEDLVGRVATYVARDRARRPALDGRDVMRLLSLAPTPRVGRILADLRAAVLDGEVAGRVEEERYVLGLAAGAGDEPEGDEGEEDQEGDDGRGA